MSTPAPSGPTDLPIPGTSATPASGEQVGEVRRPATGHAPLGPRMYEAVGGHEFFRRLVDEFYRGVAGDAPLRAMYPEADLAPAADRLRMFLEQYWGGPHTYHEQRGHPRLRLRHAPFAVTPAQRDRWLTHMRHALDEQHLDPALDAEMWAYLAGAAQFLVNAAD